jgi:hypothetical protein
MHGLAPRSSILPSDPAQVPSTKPLSHFGLPDPSQRMQDCGMEEVTSLDLCEGPSEGQGGVLLVLGMPEGMELGVDLKTFTVGPK